MQYFAGLIVFAGVGSFLITDAIDLWQNFQRRDRPKRWYVDLLRLVLLAGITIIGYQVASETFRNSQDQRIFLAIGFVGAVAAHLITQRVGFSRRS